MIQKTFNAEETKILELLKQIPDPEVEVNIVDLGLIYHIRKDDEAKTLEIDMTLSTPGCPVGDTIIQHVQNLLDINYPDFNVSVNLIWEPEWTPDFITPEGREQLY